MKLFLASAAVFLIAGCATANLSSYQDPKYANKRYSSFVVVTNFSDLDATRFIESKACEEFAKRGVQCKRGIDVFPPTRTLTNEQWVAAFDATGMEAIVFLELTDAYSTQTYIPQTSTTTGTATSSGYGTANYRGTTTTSGGYNVSKPVEKYSITVVDGKTGEKEILLTGSARGNAFASSNDLSESLAETLAQELGKAGLIPR